MLIVNYTFILYIRHILQANLYPEIKLYNKKY